MIKVYIAEDLTLGKGDLLKTLDWENLGCCIVGQTTDAKIAFHEIRKLKPDILIIDVCMSGFGSLELVELLQTEKSIEYIIVSACGRFDFALNVVNLGVNKYLLKPIETEGLEENLKECTRKLRSKKSDIEETLGSKTYSIHVTRALEFIDKNYMEHITIDDIARAVYLSNSHLSRIFKQELNMTINEYLRKLRIKHAKTELKYTNNKVSHIAKNVGYKDNRYFSHTFREYTGVLPTEYRKILK